MIKRVILKVYNSEFSKELGIYKNPLIKKIQIISKRIQIRIKRRREINYIKKIIKSDEEISDQFLRENTYELVYELSLIDIKLWRKFLNKIAKQSFEKISKKSKINVAFLCNFAATWSCDRLFQLFLQSKKFHPYIVAHHFYNGTQKTIEESVRETICFFEKKGYEVYSDTDAKNGKFLGLEQLGQPDIIFHLSPYNMAFPPKLNIFTYPLTTININIPYGIYVADLSEFQYSLPSFSAYWRIFDLPFYAKEAVKYTPLGNFNRVGSGYCKLDALYGLAQVDMNELWKVTNERQAKIIYAPHHSIGNVGQKFSTFDQNFNDILNIAKNMQNETTWIIKPHPLLKKAAVESGVFANEEKYDEYLEEWNSLPNARVVTGGDYFDIFKTSDGMILDSDSFLAEYLYVDKPLMLLDREEQKFSDLGKPLSKVLYHVKGNDIVGIKEFIIKVVLEKNDILKKNRENFFAKYLDYRQENGMLASEFIFRYICKELED